MTPAEVNTAMKYMYFIFETRKVDVTPYLSSTLYGLFAALSSAVKMSGSRKGLFEHDEFAECRKALDAAMRERSAAGFGTSVCKHTEIISEEEGQRLWEKGILGEENPQQLLDTVLYLTGLHFALRGGKERRSLRLHSNPQITGLHQDTGGRHYLCYTEDVSKTNPGGMTQRKLKPKVVRAYENDDSTRCYVRLYQKYKSL
ncbi:uncharacterized protein LOC124287048 isoform X2 [Haliotis rubra]|uniref:uncharacterized protein LOC124287048 isoform X2 n=1 Tax=Haliotis rubra TaxID=36100 RepID=UPI001EE50A50|nr:uncharacterized protein LOC124287048 isoform X2 [Haliotis rubra]